MSRQMSSSYRSIHFNALPEPARLRLAECLGGREAPIPLLTLPTGRKRGWIVLAVLGIIILFATWATPMDKEFLDAGGMVAFGLGTLCSVAGVVGVIHAMRL